jgi:hypothetical protein
LLPSTVAECRALLLLPPLLLLLLLLPADDARAARAIVAIATFHRAECGALLLLPADDARCCLPLRAAAALLSESKILFATNSLKDIAIRRSAAMIRRCCPATLAKCGVLPLRAATAAATLLSS